MARPLPVLSVIVPAHNEAATIDACLGALFLSEAVAGNVQVIVVANGCTDETARHAEAWFERFADKGWDLEVLDLPQGGKPGALNAGDARARSDNRAYLDADVRVSPALIGQIVAVLARPGAVYASGTLVIDPPKSATTRAYARIYRQVPFIAQGVPGCGFFAMNGAGRVRWAQWPEIISDDTFARLNFAPAERHAVTADYRWPLVEGWDALVRVRRRQNRGVDEIARDFPELLTNDDKPSLLLRDVVHMALRDPIGFATYAGVSLATRFGGSDAWERGR